MPRYVSTTSSQGRLSSFCGTSNGALFPLSARCQAYYVLQVRDDEVLSVSIFDSQAAAQESVRRTTDWVAQNISSLMQGLPEIAVGQVRISQMEREQPAGMGEMLREQRSLSLV